MDDAMLKAVIKETLSHRERVVRDRVGPDFHFTSEHIERVFSEVEAVKDLDLAILIDELETAFWKLEGSIHA
jgi:hypothetical protein